MRRAAKRDINEPEIVKALRQRGATVQPLSAKGVPDLLVGYLGHNLLMEVKQPGKKLTADQIEWHDTYRGSAVIVYSVEGALRHLADLEKQN